MFILAIFILFYHNLSKNLDCLQMAYKRTDITHFAFVASDSDFRHLVFKLLDLGREVLGFGESKSDHDFTGIFTTFHLLKAPELKIQAKKYKTK